MGAILKKLAISCKENALTDVDSRISYLKSDHYSIFKVDMLIQLLIFLIVILNLKIDHL